MAKVVTHSPLRSSREHISSKNTFNDPYKSKWPKLSVTVVSNILEEVERSLSGVAIKLARKKTKRSQECDSSAKPESKAINSEEICGSEKRPCLEDAIDSKEMCGSEEKRPCLEDAIDSKEMCGSEEKRPCLEDTIDSKEMCGSEETRPCLEKDCIIAGNAKKCDSLAKSESKATDSEEMCGSEEKRPCLEKDCIIAAGHADVSRDPGEDISNEERTQNSTSNCDSGKIRESQVSQKEKSTGFKRQHLVLGINAVTRLLEQRQLAAGLVCSSSPTLLYQHLLPLVAVAGVPFAAVPELSGVLSRCLGIRRAMCLGIRKSSQEPHEFSSLCEVISKLVAPVPLPWMKIPDTGCDEPTLSQKEEDEGEAEELAYKPLAIKKLKIQHGKKKKNKQK